MKNSVFKWLVKQAGNVTVPLLILVVVNAVLSAIGVRFSLVSKDAVDIAAGQADGSLLTVFLKLAALLLVQVILLTFGSFLDAITKGKYEIRIKRSVYSRLLRKDWLTVSQYHSGELLTRLTSDVNIVVSGVCDIIPQFVSFAVTIVLSVYYLFVLAPSFTVCLIPLVPVVFVLGRVYSKKLKTIHKKCQAADGKTRSFMQEMLQNVVAVKAFRAENGVSDNAENLQTVAYKLKIKKNIISISAGIGLYVIFTFGYYAALSWGAVKIAADMLTYGSLVAILRLVSQIQAPLRSMSSLFSNAVAMFASAERIIELEDLAEEKSAVFDLENYDNVNKICLNDVSFTYGDSPVLESADIEINKSDFVAISGISGIGKSTLLKLLLGLIKPSSGEIYLDGEGKIPVDESTRSYFAYVPQENMILSGTIRDNIAFYRDIPDDKIDEAVRIACIDSFVSAFPDGLDTVLKEGGAGLSGGQIQRIAVARAFVSDAKMLLLDEATSALDEETESRLLKNIRENTDKGCIIVSHKSAAIGICNKIIRVENGKIIGD